MNKLVIFGAAALAAAGLAACNNTNANNAAAGAHSDKEVLYSGVLPAADADGTAYVLKLDFDDDHNFTEGDFAMTESTLAVDTLTGALKEVATSYTEGDFAKKSKVVDGATVEYIQLAPDAHDALGAPSACSLYFIVNADQSLTMVDANLNKAANDSLNYTLTVK